MKHLTIAIFCLINIAVSNAQTFSEWFRQKKTQEKYLTQQIAGLEVYANYLKKGYDIFDKGSKTISKIKSGDFDMHHLFFSDQNRLNPNLSKLVKDLEIEPLNTAVMEKCIRSKKFILAEPVFGAKQKEYLKTVFERIEKNAKELFTDYEQLVEPDRIMMDDEERLKHLMSLKFEYLSLYRFANSFDDGIRWYNQQMKIERNDVSASRLILGLKP